MADQEKVGVLLIMRRSLQTVALEVSKVIFQEDSTVNLVKQLI